MRATEAHVGAFVTPRRPVLKLSAALKTGSVTVPAGEYTVGVIKNADRDWTMALYPGVLARADKPDVGEGHQARIGVLRRSREPRTTC